jgi:hypothetical protein
VYSLWQQFRQKQKCVNLKNFLRDIEIDVAFVEDLVVFIGILVYAEYVYVDWYIMGKYRVLQNQVGKNFIRGFIG